jgi:hypothetical protein
MSILADYLVEIRTIRNLGAGVAETSYYPALANLFNAVGKHLKPKVVCLIHLQDTGGGIPEAGFFTANQIQRTTGTLITGQKPSRGALEVKAFAAKMDQLATSAQVLKYLTHYNQVLITNLREFRLLVLENGVPHKVDGYELAKNTEALFHPSTLKDHADLFPEFIERVLRRQSSITDPSDLAWFLASYAREARWRAENHGLSSFDTIKKALEESLGLRFEGEKGDHFFRSTLVQTLFYGIFSAWVLWCRTEGQNAATRFDWRTSAYYLRVPVLRKLFNEVSDPGPLNAIQITEMLDLAGDTLARVDRPAFFSKFSQADAVQYFYEPFLEAFDPQLRKDLGVWYTPREIVHYMVERVDHLLRTELNQPLGLASPDVCVLDPCCGTGAYLNAVLDRVHRTLLAEAGDDAALVPDRVRTAALTRIFGFEILPAPFVIAHMQLAAELASLGAPLTDNQRAGVFLTNALTGWVPEQEPKTSIFPDLQREKEDAEAIKRRPSILVILGNPPYNGYSGIARIDEERDLTTAYRAPVHGLPKPQGQGLNDLYIRFFRIAERRILQNASGEGIVCFISNNAWLDGLSHTTMRHHYLQAFQHIFIDNLNGDKYRTGKTTPDGKPDPSAFSTPQNREGIQVGTAIATLVRSALPAERPIEIRDLWGTTKLSILEQESKQETTPTYVALTPKPALGNPFAARIHSADYTSWPKLPELFPVSFPGIKTSRDPLVVDIDRDRLEARMRSYFDKSVSNAEFAQMLPDAMEDGYMYDAATTRATLQQRGFRSWEVLRYCYRPFDLRWIYWEPTTSLLRRKVGEYVEQMIGATTWIEARQREAGDSFCRGTVTQCVADNFGNGLSSFFPQSVLSSAGEMFQELHEDFNLSNRASTTLINIGANRADLFHHALSVLHTPAYRTENAGALLGDWPRIPLPATAELLAHSATLGRRLAELLDPESDLQLVGEWSFLARLVLPQPSDLAENLKLTAGWGSRGQGSTVMPGRGKSEARPWSEIERERLTTLAAAQSLSLDQALSLLGESCFDIYLNGATLWTAVPANVWSYTLGGYQVLKKWLSYRELPLLGRALRSDESDYFAQVVRRITAILLLGPALDASYQMILPAATGLPES